MKKLTHFAAAACVMAAPAASARAPELFLDAGLKLSDELIREHRRAECHTRKVGGDGSAIHRPGGKINTPGALRGVVDCSSTELELGLFPEGVTAVAAVLQRDHYRFGMGPAAAPHPASGRQRLRRPALTLAAALHHH